MKHRAFLKWLALTAVFVAFFAFLSTYAEGDELYFTAINDELLDLKDSTMPYRVYDQFYVPYTIFDDLSLGVFYSYNKDIYKLTFYNKHNTLIFDLLMSVAYNDEQQYRQRVISRNDTLYIPIEFVCSQFGLSLSHINAAPITILRVISGSSLDSVAFRQKNAARMTEEYKDYMGLNSVSPSKTPTPSPSQSIGPGTSPSQPPKNNDQHVYIAFAGSSGSELSGILDILDRHGLKASFFFESELIDKNGDRIRRAFGSGHSIGLQGSSVDELEKANTSLDLQIATKTRIVRMSGGEAEATGEERAVILDEGFRIWEGTITAGGDAEVSAWDLADSIVNAIRSEDDLPIVLVFEGEWQTEALSLVLNFIENGNYSPELITQSVKPID